MAFNPTTTRPHALAWVNGQPVVTYTCTCSAPVPVAGVTTIGGALAATAAAGIHQH